MDEWDAEKLRLLVNYFETAIEIGNAGTQVPLTAKGLAMQFYLEMSELS